MMVSIVISNSRETKRNSLTSTWDRMMSSDNEIMDRSRPYMDFYYDNAASGSGSTSAEDDYNNLQGGGQEYKR